MNVNTIHARVRLGFMVSAILLASAAAAWAGGHTWRVSEVFTNACGDVQFVELLETGGGAGETGVNGHNVTAATLGRTYLIPPPARTPPTSNKTLLFATPAFAALPGVPTPDYIFPAGSVPFFSAGGDSLAYQPFPAMTFGAGLCPTNGILSLRSNLTTGVNSPKNYAGVTASVDLSCGLAGDVNNSGAVDGEDIAGFVRVMTGTALISDKIGCANYCGGSPAANIAAFVADLLN